jgi:hypothetical protein
MIIGRKVGNTLQREREKKKKVPQTEDMLSTLTGKLVTIEN